MPIFAEKSFKPLAKTYQLASENPKTRINTGILGKRASSRSAKSGKNHSNPLEKTYQLECRNLERRINTGILPIRLPSPSSKIRENHCIPLEKSSINDKRRARTRLMSRADRAEMKRITQVRQTVNTHSYRRRFQHPAQS